MLVKRESLEGGLNFWPQNGFRIDLTGSGGPSYIQVGPHGSDVPGLGALKPKFKGPKKTKHVFLFLKNLFFQLIHPFRGSTLKNPLQRPSKDPLKE